MPAKKDLYSKVYHLNNLNNAWDKVKSNGLSSQSEHTRKLILEFDNGSKTRIKKLKKQLLDKKFNFSKSKGIPIPREGKDDRPLVVSPIENRIVQRAILNVLNNEKGIEQHIDVPTSFGGVEKKSVKMALDLIVEKMNSGAIYFARSDIKSFFTKIPAADVLEIIFSSLSVDDQFFKQLLVGAVKTELENLDQLGDKASLFPLDDTGVAQGSCLSPLLGNIFLSNFDKISNSEDVTCIRFVDDYVLLGPSDKAVKAKFLKGKKFLSDKGLDVYDPFGKGSKGEHGHVQKGFNFLGCDIRTDRISPSNKKVIELKGKITSKINKSLFSDELVSLADTLISINNTVSGWGNSYSFCNNKNLMDSIDNWIVDATLKYNKDFSKKIVLAEELSKKALLLGVKSLSLCKHEPIYKIKKTKEVSRE